MRLVFLILLLFQMPGAKAWEVDFSRRQLDFQKVEDHNRLPASTSVKENSGFLAQAFESAEPSQEIVITNTEKGFVPNTLRLRKGGNYKIHVVNINAKDKNVSFVMDAFSESHNTVYGTMRSFTITPKESGTFSYLCPETAEKGKLIIYSDERKPAGE